MVVITFMNYLPAAVLTSAKNYKNKRKFNLTKSTKEGECIICLEKAICSRNCKKCTAIACQNCIKEWFLLKRNCPQCRGINTWEGVSPIKFKVYFAEYSIQFLITISKVLN